MKELRNVSLEEIVFEKREKSYGAYFLRKQYPKQLLFSFFIVGSLFSLAILIPFIWGNEIKKTPIKENINLVEELPPPPPSLPPSNEAIDFSSNTGMYCGPSKLVTLILEKDHKIRWWFGYCDKDSIKTTDYSEQGLRKVLERYLHYRPWLPLCSDSSVAKDKFGNPLDKSRCWKPFFLIKPRHNSQYQDLIKVMNELLILNIKSYTVNKFTKDDSLEMLGIRTLNEPPPPPPIQRKRKIAPILPPDSILQTEEPSPNAFVFPEANPKPLNYEEVCKQISYPPTQGAIQGNVILRILVDEQGNYVRHIISKPVHPLLLTEVEKNVHKLRFSPSIQKGKPTKAWANVAFKFE